MAFVWVPGSSPPSIEEHSLAKLAVLRSYLSSYFDRLGGGGSRRDVFKLDLVDGFSGGGLFFQDGKEVSGTPLVMLEEAEAAYVRLNENRIKPLRFDLKFHFVDVVLDHTMYLSRLLEERRFNISEHSVQVHNNAFSCVVLDIIADIKRRQPISGRSLFLLDQKGFSQVELELVSRIFGELPNAEVILTFAADALVNLLSDRPQMYSAVKPLGLSVSEVRDFVEMKNGAGGRAVVQRVLRDHIRVWTGATYDTPFFIRPRKSRRALWFVHLSRHPVARDVMVQCHWNNFNAFEHYGSGSFDMLGWDPLKNGLSDGQLPIFNFSDLDAESLHEELVGSISSEILSSGLVLPMSVEDFRISVANRTAARFSDLDRALVRLTSAHELAITSVDGKVYGERKTHLMPSDQIDLPIKRMFPGFSFPL